MERLHAYIGSVQSAFQQAPEVFHPVGMNVAIHIFNRVVDDGVIVLRIQAFVSLVISEFEQPRCSRASRPEPSIVSLKLEFTELQCSFGQRDPVDPECPEVTSNFAPMPCEASAKIVLAEGKRHTSPAYRDAFFNRAICPAWYTACCRPCSIWQLGFMPPCSTLPILQTVCGCVDQPIQILAVRLESDQSFQRILSAALSSGLIRC
jgi:hypothetical protein